MSVSQVSLSSASGKRGRSGARRRRSSAAARRSCASPGRSRRSRARGTAGCAPTFASADVQDDPLDAVLGRPALDMADQRPPDPAPAKAVDDRHAELGGRDRAASSSPGGADRRCRSRPTRPSGRRRIAATYSPVEPRPVDPPAEADGGVVALRDAEDLRDRSPRGGSPCRGRCRSGPRGRRALTGRISSPDRGRRPPRHWLSIWARWRRPLKST